MAFSSSDWPSSLSNKDSKDWNLGVEIIKDRFESRFIKPIDSLINHSDKIVRCNSGFVIMSIDCLLIETLNQFYFGLNATTEKYHKRNADPNNKFNWQAFRDFFTHSSYFPDFQSDHKLTELFFNEIRCGLLHQAESKSQSLINMKGAYMVRLNIPGDYKGGVTINRTLFHKSVKLEFYKYLDDLGKANSTNILGENLRERCNKKMVNICS